MFCFFILIAIKSGYPYHDSNDSKYKYVDSIHKELLVMYDIPDNELRNA